MAAAIRKALTGETVSVKAITERDAAAWLTDEAKRRGLRVDQEHDGRVIDGIILVGQRGLLEKYPEAASQVSQLVIIAGDTDGVRVEMTEVLIDDLRRIPFGVDADEDYPWRRRAPRCDQLLSRAGQHLQRQRTDVRTLRKAEEDEIPVAGEIVTPKGPASLVEQDEFGQLGGAWQDGRRFRHRRRHEQLERQPRAGADGDECTDCNKKFSRVHIFAGERSSNRPFYRHIA